MENGGHALLSDSLEEEELLLSLSLLLLPCTQTGSGVTRCVRTVCNTPLEHACRTVNVDVSWMGIVLVSTGQPDAMVICHLPHGPAAHFSLSNVALRHDLPEKPVNMSEVSTASL